MLPPITRPSATGSTGWREPDRAKKRSIQPRRAGEHDHDGVALAEQAERDARVLHMADRQRPGAIHASSSASVRTTTCFVS